MSLGFIPIVECNTLWIKPLFLLSLYTDKHAWMCICFLACVWCLFVHVTRAVLFYCSHCTQSFVHAFWKLCFCIVLHLLFPGHAISHLIVSFTTIIAFSFSWCQVDNVSYFGTCDKTDRSYIQMLEEIACSQLSRKVNKSWFSSLDWNCKDTKGYRSWFNWKMAVKNTMTRMVSWSSIGWGWIWMLPPHPPIKTTLSKREKCL